MEFYVEKAPLHATEEPLLIAGIFADESEPPAPLRELDERSGGLLARLLGDGEFRGKPRETRLLNLSAEEGPARLLLVGLGKRGSFDAEALRRAAGAAAVAAEKARTGRIAFALPLGEGVGTPEQARALTEAAALALYRYDQYLTEKPDDRVEVTRLTLVSHDDTPEEEIGPEVSLGRVGAEAAAFCRDLANTPAIDATPTWMAEQARLVADEFGLTLTVIEKDEMEAKGMGGLLGVASGSDQPPKLVVLEHNAGRDDLDTVCLVGKGVTFDTGGISIKPSEKMEDMKFDKCGACAVIAAMRAVGALRLPLHVVGITPLTENMPGGKAYRPGDVLRLSNGKTIEVLNTDAEGRLILADALVHATTFEPKAIVDLATLTGACVIALGHHRAGVMSSDDGLAEKLIGAGDVVGERLWRLPLGPEYREQIKSSIADMTNLGGKPAGTITAAALLAEFVEEYPWAHLDIAGTAWTDKDRDYLKKGGTGYGVRLLVEFLRNW